MMENPNITYQLNTKQYDLDFESYTNFEKSFGHFIENGTEYVITDKNTPRQWFGFMVNDKFASVAANDGGALSAYGCFDSRITRYSNSRGDYLLRRLDGRRTVMLKNLSTNEKYDLLKDCKNLQFTVKPGEVIYSGQIAGLEFSVEIFVPNEQPCEIWIINLKKTGAEEDYILTASQDIALRNQIPFKDIYQPVCDTLIENDTFYADSKNFYKENDGLCAVFFMQEAKIRAKENIETGLDGKEYRYTCVDLSKKITIGETDKPFFVMLGADRNITKCREMKKLFMSEKVIFKEKEKNRTKWKDIIEHNNCNIPNKNLEYFLNVWLKNQLYLTMRYNRFHIMGYRDVMQDCWGHMLVSPEDTKAYFLEALTYMYEDGRCPRAYDRFNKVLDSDDFMDSPTWIPYTVCEYVKETGDFDILNLEIGYYNSGKTGSVLEHILLSLEYLYHSRGKNGLILMRDGDWLDGLSGINKYGEATTVWGTIAAYNAQSLIIELLERLGQTETAELLKKRSQEYKNLVNTVGWDGNWYIYAFIDDEPIGSSSCKEGKIYLNPQTWAIFSGICDDKKRIEKIYRSISTYLDSMYGPHLLAPAYTKYGEKCGRLQKQRPGTFANQGVYLHGGAFKLLADCKLGNYDGALDLIMRILPGHQDNCDTRRTCEPYSVGNNYYGVVHPCNGMNLYSWFTATPAWLIHGGFDCLLGISADYDGLKIEPHEISDWNEYSVNRYFRGTNYKIVFKKSSEKGIIVDGMKIIGNIVNSDNRECNVEVFY